MNVDFADTCSRLSHMRRLYRPNMRRTRGLLDAAPLVDVALLLFLFFVANASFVVQPGIRVDLPEAAFTDASSYASQVVMISQENLIFFNDERSTLEGLGPAFKQCVHEQKDTSLLIEADGRVDNAKLVRIYTLAREAGIQDVVLATRLPAPEE